MIQRGVSTVAEVETAINDKAREEYVDAQDTATLDAAKAYTDKHIATRETPAGAQNKADAVLKAAKGYTDNREGVIRTDFAKGDTYTLATAKAMFLETVAALKAGAGADYDTLKKLQTKIEAINKAIAGTDTPDVIDTLNEALSFIREHQSEIESLVNTYVKKEAIADNLTTDDATQVLSAARGVELKALIDTVTASLAGLITDEEREKLEGVEAGANNYTLPVATAEVLGGVKAGNNVTIAEDGTLSATSGGGGAMYTIDFALSEIDQQKTALNGLLAAHTADPNIEVRIKADPFLLTPVNVNITGENVIIIANLLPPTEMSPRKAILSVLIVATRNEAGEIATIELWESREDNLGGDIPVASSIVLGGIKVGNNLSMREDGTLDAEAGGGTTAVSPDAGNTIEQRENGLYVPTSSGGGEVSDGRIRVSGVFDADGNIVSGEGFTLNKIEGGPIFVLKFPTIGDRPYVVTVNSLVKSTDTGIMTGFGMVIVMAHLGLDAVSGEPVYDAGSCMLMFQPMGESGDNGGHFAFEAVTLFSESEAQAMASVTPGKIHIGGVVNADGTIAAGDGFTVEKGGGFYAITHPFGSEPFTVQATPICDPAMPILVMPVVIGNYPTEGTIMVTMMPMNGDDGSCKFAFEAESVNTVASGSAGVSPAEFEALKMKVTGIEATAATKIEVSTIKTQIGSIGTVLDIINGEEV